jgi:oxygen-independent coproporphyrinogen-3 oxidase
MVLQKSFLKGESVSTVYFGGGTPSLLPAEDLNLLMQTLHTHFNILPDAELTLEANPDDINMGILKSWQAVGINRLSVGIQSFFEEELRWMNRAHNAEQAHRSIEQITAAGYSNFSIDLIYGSPLLSDEMWRRNVDTAVNYGVPHLSCYALTVEEKTPLHKQIVQQKKPGMDSDKQARQFLQLMQWLNDAGYAHYEVSNFARAGYRSRHNSAYWKGIPYLGIGPSAHSYNGIARQWNVSNNPQYIQSVNAGLIPSETEMLTGTQKLNEYIMIALRTQEGLDLRHLEAAWGFEKVEKIVNRSARYIENRLLHKTASRLQLTNEGMLMADGIASHLFF